MTRVELARMISEKYDMDFDKVLRGVDAGMDEEFGVEVNEVPAETAKEFENGFATEAEYIEEMKREIEEEHNN